MTAPAPHYVLLGSSALMQGVRAALNSLAAVPWPLRIEGPTGTGKTVAARLLHDLSPRSRAPFVSVSVSSLSESLALGQLVGHARGAFTGAVNDAMGVFEAAHSGTLFLDEIGTAAMGVQLMLLPLLQAQHVQRIGEHRARHVNVRLVFATNVSLEQEVSAGRFREDLLHRMGTLRVQMPALKDHADDIPELAKSIIADYARELGVMPSALDRRELSALQAYDWPGNVRELQNVLQLYMVSGDLLGSLAVTARPRDWRLRLPETLVRCKGVKSATARALGVSRKTVHEELRRRQGLETPTALKA